MNTPAVKLFKALADKTRFEIVREVAHKKEVACQELVKQFSLAQPTLSHHCNKLIDAQVLNTRKEGVLWFYSLNKRFLKTIGLDINRLFV